MTNFEVAILDINLHSDIIIRSSIVVTLFHNIVIIVVLIKLSNYYNLLLLSISPIRLIIICDVLIMYIHPGLLSLSFSLLFHATG